MRMGVAHWAVFELFCLMDILRIPSIYMVLGVHKKNKRMKRINVSVRS